MSVLKTSVDNGQEALSRVRHTSPSHFSKAIVEARFDFVERQDIAILPNSGSNASFEGFMRN